MKVPLSQGELQQPQFLYWIQQRLQCRVGIWLGFTNYKIVHILGYGLIHKLCSLKLMAHEPWQKWEGLHCPPKKSQQHESGKFQLRVKCHKLGIITKNTTLLEHNSICKRFSK